MLLETGMKVATKTEKMSYYKEAIVPKGSVGEVMAVRVPVVRNTNGHLYFNCVDFTINGKKVRGAYYGGELTKNLEVE